MAWLQKMKYDEDGEIIEKVCAVNKVQHGGEYTLCGNAIPDSTLDTFGCEPSGEEYKGKLSEVTCPGCINLIQFIRGLK